MCGRFALYQEIEPLLDDLDAADVTSTHLRARWNIPPTAPIYVVHEATDRDTGEIRRALQIARWGLLPPFAKDETFSSRTFNARRETLASKPSFRGSLSQHRAIIPMDGYYEWVRRDGKRTTPYVIHAADGSRLYMAALTWWWRIPQLDSPSDVDCDAEHGEQNATEEAAAESPLLRSPAADGSHLLTATVITKEASGHLADIHDRAPVMLTRKAVDQWIDPQLDDREEAQAFILDDRHLLDPSDVTLKEANPRVGNVRNDGPELLEPPQRLL